jgi:hypothetical protein
MFSRRISQTQHLRDMLKILLLRPVATMPLSAKTYQKWSNRCKANKMLQDGLKNGSVDPSMKPKEVWESSIEYQKYSLPAFRSAFNRKKTEMGVHLRDDGKFPKKAGPLHAHVLLLFLCLTFAPCLFLLNCFVLAFCFGYLEMTNLKKRRITTTTTTKKTKISSPLSTKKRSWDHH